MRTKHHIPLIILFLAVSLLMASCADHTANHASNQTSNQAPNPTPSASAGQTPATQATQTGQTAIDPSTASLDPKKGQEIGSVFEAYLTPQQEPGEEEDTPATTPPQFRSTAPSVPRNQRTSRGHGTLRFTRDLSKVLVDVKVENVKAEDVVMFHIHCGRPDMLGPILVDFSLSGSIQDNLADNIYSVELTNENIVKTMESGHGLLGAFLIGCPIVPGTKEKVQTIAGMEHIARQGELYFNLHTKGQVYFGEMRGQVRPVK